VNTEQALIWNRKQGMRGVGSHMFHPGLNIMDGARWASVRVQFGPLLARGDLEDLGVDPLAVEPSVLTHAIRETGDQHFTFPKQGPIAALRWLEKREDRGTVVRVLLEVLAEMDPLRSSR
jgi:hypothetical protein